VDVEPAGRRDGEEGTGLNLKEGRPGYHGGTPSAAWAARPLAGRARPLPAFCTRLGLKLRKGCCERAVMWANVG
jgi:hypothetical protein